MKREKWSGRISITYSLSITPHLIMWTIKRKIFVWALLLLCVVVVAYYIFFYSYSPFHDINQKKSKQDAILLEETPGGLHIVTQELLPLSDVFAIVAEQASFHVYYPTFLPNMLIFDRNSVWIAPKETRELVSYTLKNKDAQETLIYVVQATIDSETGNSILMRTKNFQSKQKFISDRCTGGITQATSTKMFTHLICSTEDNVAIWLRTDKLDLDTLVSIAESMGRTYLLGEG